MNFIDWRGWMSGTWKRNVSSKGTFWSVLFLIGCLTGSAYAQTPVENVPNAPSAEKTTTPAPVAAQPEVGTMAGHVSDADKPAPKPEKKVFLLVPLGEGLETYDLTYIREKMHQVVSNAKGVALSDTPSTTVSSHLGSIKQREDCLADSACLQLVEESVKGELLVDTRVQQVADGWKIELKARTLENGRELGRAEGITAIKEDLGVMGAQALEFLLDKLKMIEAMEELTTDSGEEALNRLFQSESIAVKDRLATPGIRLMAVVLDAPNCERCASTYDAWRAMGFKYGARGLSLLAVQLFSDPKSCAPPTWNQNNYVCVASKKPTSVEYMSLLSKGILFDWRGKRIGEFQTPEQMQPLIEKELSVFPKILVDSAIYDNGKAYGGKRGRKLHKTTRERIASYAKFEILKTKQEKKELKKYRKELAKLKKYKRGKWLKERVVCAEDVSMPETAVVLTTVARSRKNPWVKLDYYSPKDKCLLASVEQPVEDKDYYEAASMAAGKMIEGFVKTITVPALKEDGKDREWILLTIPEPEKKSSVVPVVAAQPVVDKPRQAPKPPEALKKEKKAEEEPKEEEKTEKEFELSWFTLAPKSGYAYYMQGSKLINEDLKGRGAVLLALGLDMGGEGAAFSLEPTYGYEMFGGNLKEIHMLGLHMGFNHRWVINRWAIPSLGLGIRSGYLMGDNLKYGLESYARLPIGYTFYPSDYLGITMEFALGYGLTGLLPKGAIDKAACEQQNDIREQLGEPTVDCSGEDFSLSHGMLVEFMVGIRFP